MGYSLHYTFASMQSTLPWSSCSADYLAHIDTCYLLNSQEPKCPNSNSICQTASEQYWERYVLGINNASYYNQSTIFDQPFGDIGEIKWDLSLCLLLSWIIVFICLHAGIKSSGKVVYFTGTFPYLILMVLFVRCLMPDLDGATIGIK